MEIAIAVFIGLWFVLSGVVSCAAVHRSYSE